MTKSKLSTPDWIREGFDSKEEYEKQKGIKGKKKSGNVFNIRLCPQCGSNKVAIVLGEEEGKSSGEWECRKCGWRGHNVSEKELTEDEFMKYLDENGVDVS